MDKKYKLEYLLLFEHDLAAARDHIAYTLQNPSAALRLVDDTEAAILKRLSNPTAFPKYRTAKKRKYPYYWIGIRNYMVFYVVIGNVMEVRRFIFAKRNMQEIIG